MKLPFTLLQKVIKDKMPSLLEEICINCNQSQKIADSADCAVFIRLRQMVEEEEDKQ